MRSLAGGVETLGFSAAEVESIIDVTSSLLHLGDLVLETLRALRAGTETPARRCAPKTTRRAAAACAALDANVALDADAMARG